MAKLSVYAAYNGKPAYPMYEATSRAKARKWIDSAVAPRGHTLVIVDDKGDVHEHTPDSRCIVPMGWGFKKPWETQRGRAASDLTIYQPAAGHMTRN